MCIIIIDFHWMDKKHTHRDSKSIHTGLEPNNNIHSFIHSFIQSALSL